MSITTTDWPLDIQTMPPMGWLGLSETERSVLGWIMSGKKAEEVAELHGTTIGTVRTQIKAILHKAGDKVGSQISVVGMSYFMMLGIMSATSVELATKLTEARAEIEQLKSELAEAQAS